MRFLLASSVLALCSLTLADPLNDIDDLCHGTFGNPPAKAQICLKQGSKAEWSTYIGNTGYQLCCAVGDTCLLSNETMPIVACYDPTDGYAKTATNREKCNLVNGKCDFIGTIVTLSTGGVDTITAVKNGKGVISSSSGGSTTTGSATTSGGSAAATTNAASDVKVVGGMMGLSLLALLL